MEVQSGKVCRDKKGFKTVIEVKNNQANLPTDGSYITENTRVGGAEALGALPIFPLRASEYNVVVICLQPSDVSETRIENGRRTVFRIYIKKLSFMTLLFRRLHNKKKVS